MDFVRIFVKSHLDIKVYYFNWTTLYLKWTIHMLHDSSKELQYLPS